MSETGEESAPPPTQGWTGRLEGTLLLSILGALLVIGLLPILARRLPGVTAPLWGGRFSQQAVLWIALLGALAATRDRKHIAIDALGQLLRPRARLALLGVTELMAAGIVGLLVPAATRFAAAEAEQAGDRIAFLGLPDSWLAAVVPIGLACLAARLLACGFADVTRSLRGDRS
ncbi:MAG: TRAP transporter small permease [Planctomycetota bacterium]